MSNSEKQAAHRAINSCTISFGLVAIPIKIYTAASDERVHFNMLHTKCGGKIKQQYICPVDNGDVVSKEDVIKGYEFAKGKFVHFTNDELVALETEKSKVIDIKEFVPLDTVDFVFVEKSYYIGADKGSNKPYHLLAQCMQKKEVVAVGQWAARGKEQLVLIRPYEDGLILHQLYYANEVRSFENISGTKVAVSDAETNLAEQLIDQLTSDIFEPSKYKDSYVERVQAAIDQKINGKSVISALPAAPVPSMLDLMATLKASLGSDKPKPTKNKQSAKKKKVG